MARSRSGSKGKKLRVVPLGGLGEIGKNMTVFEYGNDAVIVDTGIMFPANDMHGVDFIIPDFRYLTERTDLKIHGIFYTHGHEDHTGAVAHVIEQLRGIPIYATPLTAGLLEVKLRDARLLKETKINVIKAGDIIEAGPFKMESFHVCHSIPDGVGYGIHTPLGVIVHTGDYKFDNSPIDGKKPDYAKLAEFGKQGALLLMGDSTNADRAGWTPSEIIIESALEEVFRNAKGRIMVATFASLISRVQMVAKMAKKYGRKIAVAGYSMTENIKMARRLGILDIPDNILVDIGNANSIEANKIVIMITGSQGEPTAVLTRIANNNHRHLELRQGDTIVLSSHPIPGNEEMVYRTINRLFQRGADVVYDPIKPVHVSGHASREEMRLMLGLVQPKYFMPVHGELRHLIHHGKLAEETGVKPENIFVMENGMVLEIDKGGARRAERVPGGYVFVDGSGVGDIGKSVIRDRETLARDGFMIISAEVSKKTGKLVGEPEIISRGFVYLRESDDLFRQVKQTIVTVLDSTNGKTAPARRQERLQESLGRMLYNETKRRPMIFSIIHEV